MYKVVQPRLLLFVLAGLALVACAGPRAAVEPGAKPQGRQTPERRWVERTLAHMTLREKVGQLFVINAYGQSVQDPNPQMVALNKQYYGVSTIKQLLAKYHPGGIIYFNWTNNLLNPPQINALSNGIQRLSKIPMLISTDQEQGEVLRIGPPATVFPGNMALGATRSDTLAGRAANVTGQELRAMGINVDDAPVVDVNVNPLNEADGIRSFGDRPSFVARFAASAVSGYQYQQSTVGVAATAKHFPGLGDTTINSDNGKSISEQTLADIRRTNFPPFRAAIRDGLVDMVMAGHIVFPNIKPPRGISSLSRFFVGTLLRHDLRYNGVVITDALNAGALAGLSPKTVALGAIRAGDDMLLEIGQSGVDTGKADLVTAYPAVLTAVQTGDVGIRRLNESVRRILRLKWRLGLGGGHKLTAPSRVTKVVGTPQHLAEAEDISNRSITLLKNSARLLPLARNTGKNVLVTGFGETTTATLGQDLASRGLVPQVLATGSGPSPAQIEQAVAAAKANDLVVVTTFNAWGSPAQVQLVNALQMSGTPMIVYAVGTPYDIAYFPTVSTFITSYDYQSVSHHAAVRAMFGEFQITGKLPVTITEPPPSKTVLYPFGYGLRLQKSAAGQRRSSP
jgi:beta-N-acetylhexosaminidase